MRCSIHYLSVILVAAVMVSTLSARAADESKTEIRVIRPTKNDPAFESRLQTARRLIKARDYMGASSLLEQLQAEQPTDPVVYNLSRNCYDQLHFYGKSEMLARRLLESYPENYRYQSDLANTLFRQQMNEEGLQAYVRLVDLARSENEYLRIVDGLLAFGFHDEALKLVERFEGMNLSPSALAMQRGQIYERQARYGEAARVYFGLVDDTTRTGVAAEKRLSALLDFQDSAEATEEILLQMADSGSGLRSVRLLTAHYLATGRLEHAFEFARREDSLGATPGNTMAFYLRTCLDRKLYSQAAKAGEYLLNRYANSPVLMDVHFMYGRALTELGRYPEAIEVYDSAAARFPRIQDKGEALYEIGAVFLDRTLDYPMAMTYFDSVVNHYPRGIGYLKSRLAIPYCHLRQGQLAEATTHFKQLIARQINKDILEEIAFRLAQIQFCNQQFDSTRVALRKHLVDYPQGYYVNDAMKMLLLIEKAEQSPRLLRLYSEAVKFELQREVDSTENRLTSLADNQNRALADVALYRLMALKLEKPDTTAALTVINRLEEEFPESYYLPYGLKIKADIILTDPDTALEAQKLYRSLLKQYPNYPFSSEVRNKLRELEVDSRIG